MDYITLAVFFSPANASTTPTEQRANSIEEGELSNGLDGVVHIGFCFQVFVRIGPDMSSLLSKREKRSELQKSAKD